MSAYGVSRTTVKMVQIDNRKVHEIRCIYVRNHEYGDYVFIECMDESGVIRIALPPRVSDLIASQRDALTKRRRSISSRAAMKARIEAGEVLGFAKSTEAHPLSGTSQTRLRQAAR